MFEFIIGHFNYWACIVLMMIGLYVVVSRGNFVKTIIGLGLFQTSVILLYITMAKVAGGTAPIYDPDDARFAGGHGGGHGEVHGEAEPGAGHDTHAAEGAGDGAGDHGHSDDGGHGAEPAEEDHGAAAKIDNPLADSAKAARMAASGARPGSDGPVGDPPEHAGELHAGEKALNPESFKTAAKSAAERHSAESLHAELSHDTHHAADDHGAHSAEAVDGGIIYSNPLPHVLMLTAIVVGVATTAVGLALAVRIREAYGTIEEDEIQLADDAVEFGRRDGPQDATA